MWAHSQETYLLIKKKIIWNIIIWHNLETSQCTTEAVNWKFFQSVGWKCLVSCQMTEANFRLIPNKLAHDNLSEQINTKVI